MKYLRAALLLFVPCLVSAAPAAAQPDTNALNVFLTLFRAAATSAESLLRGLALNIVIALAILEITVYALGMRERLAAAALAARLAVITFFIAVVANVSQPVTPRRLVEGAEEIAAAITRLDGMDPGTLIDQGLHIFGKVSLELLDFDLLMSPADGIAHALAAVVTLLAYILIALQVTLTLIQGGFLLTVSPLFLSFGASRWTIGAAEAFVNHLLSWCIKLILLSVVLSIGDQIAAVNQALLDAGDSLDLFARFAIDIQVMVLTLAYAVTAAIAPGMVSSKLGIQFNLTQLLPSR